MSTATASNLTAATQRHGKGSAAKGSVAIAAQARKDARQSHRQALSYKQDELKQFKVPNLTIKDLLSAIPAHCFERSAWKSSMYVLADFILVGLLATAVTLVKPAVAQLDLASSPLTPYISAEKQASALTWAGWSAYWVLQGMVFTGIWVIAHECGHQSYSASKTINNTVGWFLHSALLVPYHSWRISHARHHAATGHLTRDEVFVPRTRAQKGLLPLKAAAAQDAEDETLVAKQLDGLAATEDTSKDLSAKQNKPESEETWGEWLVETLEDAPLYNFIFIVVQQLLGWPLYLLQNSSGQLHYPKSGTNHFNPDAIIFDARHRSQILISDLGIALALSALGTWTYFRGFGEVFAYYGIPYLFTNHWLVMITFLQHTDPVVPHYSSEAWTFPRGALCTVDRKWLGPVGPYLFHGIAETHVLHHVSSKIPHYHAWEATEALKARLGEHYQSSDENVFISLWKSISQCKYVEETDAVAFYRNANGVPQACVAKEHADNSDSGMALSE
ncbi:delta-12 fatty acid desaturase [Ceraceosorus bombacis]|uniref:Delta-12 fatty acid desaturase n=1 Tax=Ceraceosorus bombacis TaxID=401625 RepID=A0A0P1BMI5_9BASI|nr:delta-12 fatty acid desaturase [Ceraceosorus bombacis]